MKGLIVGGGSIGTRHFRNLKLLGVTSLAVVEPEPQRQTVFCKEGVVCFDSLEQGLTQDPDFVVINSPTYLHVEQALQVARRGCHLFVEKPLSHTADGLTELLEEIKKQKIISLVGCNMRFHPGPVKIKELLEQNAISKILFGRIHTGSYLPSWRPDQDYRESYSAKTATGGGCILDCIHEIDLARWYLGKVEEVFCVAEHLSSLEVEAEDVAILVCRHHGGILSEIHLDFVQRTYERGCQIVGGQGSIFWNYGNGLVRWYNAGDDRWEIFAQPEEWQVNQMYLDEMRHFLNCIETGNPTVLPVSEAVEVMRIALAAKASARSGRFVPTMSISS